MIYRRRIKHLLTVLSHDIRSKEASAPLSGNPISFGARYTRLYIYIKTKEKKSITVHKGSRVESSRAKFRLPVGSLGNAFPYRDIYTHRASLSQMEATAERKKKVEENVASIYTRAARINPAKSSARFHLPASSL